MNSIKVSLYSAMILSIFSITIIISMPNAIAEENTCISYDAKENKISIYFRTKMFIESEYNNKLSACEKFIEFTKINLIFRIFWFLSYYAKDLIYDFKCCMGLDFLVID